MSEAEIIITLVSDTVHCNSTYTYTYHSLTYTTTIPGCFTFKDASKIIASIVHCLYPRKTNAAIYITKDMKNDLFCFNVDKVEYDSVDTAEFRVTSFDTGAVEQIQ